MKYILIIRIQDQDIDLDLEAVLDQEDLVTATVLVLVLVLALVQDLAQDLVLDLVLAHLILDVVILVLVPNIDQDLVHHIPEVAVDPMKDLVVVLDPKPHVQDPNHHAPDLTLHNLEVIVDQIVQDLVLVPHLIPVLALNLVHKVQVWP